MNRKTISQQIGEISEKLSLADIDERTIKNAKIIKNILTKTLLCLILFM